MACKTRMILANCLFFVVWYAWI